MNNPSQPCPDPRCATSNMPLSPRNRFPRAAKRRVNMTVKDEIWVYALAVGFIEVASNTYMS